MKNEIEYDILKYIGKKDGEIGFYHVTRMFGLPNTDFDLPTVVQNMMKEGLIEAIKGGVDSQESYRLTQKGREMVSAKN